MWPRAGILPAAPSLPRFLPRLRLGNAPRPGDAASSGEGAGGWQSHRATGGRIALVAPAQCARLQRRRLCCTCPGARGGGGRGRSGRGLQVLPAGVERGAARGWGEGLGPTPQVLIFPWHPRLSPDGSAPGRVPDARPGPRPEQSCSRAVPRRMGTARVSQAPRFCDKIRRTGQEGTACAGPLARRPGGTGRLPQLRLAVFAVAWGGSLLVGNTGRRGTDQRGEGATDSHETPDPSLLPLLLPAAVSCTFQHCPPRRHGQEFPISLPRSRSPRRPPETSRRLPRGPPLRGRTTPTAVGRGGGEAHPRPGTVPPLSPAPPPLHPQRHNPRGGCKAGLKDGKRQTARLHTQQGDGKACVTPRQRCAQAGAAVGTVNPSRRGSQGLSSAGSRASALRGAGREASPARDLIPLSFTHLSLAPSTSCEVEQTPVECPLVHVLGYNISIPVVVLSDAPGAPAGQGGAAPERWQRRGRLRGGPRQEPPRRVAGPRLAAATPRGAGLPPGGPWGGGAGSRSSARLSVCGRSARPGGPEPAPGRPRGSARPLPASVPAPPVSASRPGPARTPLSPCTCSAQPVKPSGLEKAGEARPHRASPALGAPRAAPECRKVLAALPGPALPRPDGPRPPWSPQSSQPRDSQLERRGPNLQLRRAKAARSPGMGSAAGSHEWDHPTATAPRPDGVPSLLSPRGLGRGPGGGNFSAAELRTRRANEGGFPFWEMYPPKAPMATLTSKFTGAGAGPGRSRMGPVENDVPGESHVSDPDISLVDGGQGRPQGGTGTSDGADSHSGDHAEVKSGPRRAGTSGKHSCRPSETPRASLIVPASVGSAVGGAGNARSTAAPPRRSADRDTDLPAGGNGASFTELAAQASRYNFCSSPPPGHTAPAPPPARPVPFPTAFPCPALTIREMHHCHRSRVTDEAKARSPRQGQVEDVGGCAVAAC
ncbi:collagen alpha-1(I) chain-like [Myiozetetes cayanensis]|uniref:collagen alpha-1(I) chain-like n=1 Tax=Myiozetetes cayanensis TaxID=478635 RepID=UPI002160F320|nr:collagen alpha-1(I) chain-like [Myiozetetes cayanensis]